MTRHWCDHCGMESELGAHLTIIRFQEILNRYGDLELELCHSCQDKLVEIITNFKGGKPKP